MRNTFDYFDEETYLAHHGIKGQKWGVRRYQNPDGSLTKEGALRYGSGETNNKKPVNDDPHGKRGSTSSEVGWLLANSALSLVTLNPVGAASNLYRAGTAASAAIKEKSAEKRIEKAEIDKATGLPKKSKECSAEIDVKMVNPGFKNFNTNTKNNCVLCSTAFELRRRGFDVVAAKASIGYTSDEYGRWFKGAKTESHQPFTYASSLARPSRKRGKELFEWANPKLLSQGDGARGYLSVQWGPAAGHSMAYEVRNGNVLVFDAQSGRTKSLKSITNASVNIGFTRLDNLEPDYKAMRKDGVIP